MNGLMEHPRPGKRSDNPATTSSCDTLLAVLQRLNVQQQAARVLNNLLDAFQERDSLAPVN